MQAAARVLLALLVTGSAVGCRPTIASINANPPKYYEERVTVRGRVSRREVVGAEALLELADARERRILALVPTDEAPPVGTWVKVTGVLTADRRVGDVIVYDLIVADSVRGASARPWWRPW